MISTIIAGVVQLALPLVNWFFKNLEKREAVRQQLLKILAQSQEEVLRKQSLRNEYARMIDELHTEGNPDDSSSRENSGSASPSGSREA